MKRREPLVSIVLPYYNSEEFIAQAIKSILNQSFKYFELILINDGSQDHSTKIVESFHDKRIVLIHKSHEFISSLNAGLTIAKGKYIARMDADDIMHPDRLLVQAMLLERNKQIDFCSCWCTVFNDETGEIFPMKTRSGEIRNPLVSLLLNNCFVHPSMMFRRTFMEKHKLKYKPYKFAEDYKLWLDAANAGAKFHIEPQILLFYRYHPKQISEINKKEQKETGLIIRKEIMQSIIPQISPDLQSLYMHLEKLENKNMITSETKYRFMHTLLIYNDINI